MNKKKKSSSRGMLIGALVFLIPIVFGLFFMYEMSFRQQLVVSSESPGKLNEIEINETGEPVNNSPTTIIMKSGKEQFEIGLRNNGAFVTEENVSLVWLNDDEAEITLFGTRQEPVAVYFNAKNDPAFELGIVNFEDLSYLIESTESPNGINVIEVKLVGVQVDDTWQLETEVSYGKKGETLASELVEYGDELFVADSYNFNWDGDSSVEIEFLQRDSDGTLEVGETLQLDF